jgi:hypothetical protein
VARSWSRGSAAAVIFGIAVLCAGCGDDAAETTDTGATDDPVAESTSLPTVDPAASATTIETVIPTTQSSDESEATVTEPTGTGPIGGIDPGVQPQIDLAVADLAGRLSVDPSTITVVSAAFVVWPDKGLGCPQHGMEYLQVQVDGTLIELEAGGERYRYHSGEMRPPFLCERTFTAEPLAPDESTPDAST